MEYLRNWFTSTAYAAQPTSFTNSDGDDQELDQRQRKGEEFADEKPMRQGEVEEGSGNDKAIRTNGGASTSGASGDDDEDEDLSKETCGFCKFMKMGPCRKPFTAWSKCVDEAKEKNEDFVDKCMEQTQALRACMEANPDYYAPVMFDEDEEGEEGDGGAEGSPAQTVQGAKGGPHGATAAGSQAQGDMKKTGASN